MRPTWKTLSACSSAEGSSLSSKPSARFMRIDRRTEATASQPISLVVTGRSISLPWNRSWLQ